MNSVLLTGRIAQIHEFDTSTAFNIAINEQTKQGEKTDFISCICFGNTAVFLKKYFCKGKWIEVSGRLSSFNKDGKYKLNVIADRIGFVGAKEHTAQDQFSQAGFTPPPNSDNEDFPF